MRHAKQMQNANALSGRSGKVAFALLLMGLCVARTLGEEVCARTDGSAVRDATTGSIVMAGAAVVGMASNRSVTFVTDPTTCGSRPQGGDRFPDCDADGVVTLVDLQCLSKCLAGPDVTAQESCTQFDLDGNGVVDLGDVSNFQTRFGTSIGGA